MPKHIKHSLAKSLIKGLRFILTISFIATSFHIPSAYAIELPAPGVRVSLSPDLVPPIIRGMTIDVKNPFAFNFLIDHGDNEITQDQKKFEYEKLIKYFLAAMTIAEDKQWVNLSPYEGNRIVDTDFGRTEMGRDLLAQDYMLKQITASLLYPEEETGRKFWAQVYKEAAEKYGTTQIPINTFNKVWIVPETADVYEKGDTVLVVQSKMKVMLEEDYLATDKNRIKQNVTTVAPTSDPTKDPKGIAKQVLMDIVIPALTKEVNEGENFANLRQIYNSMVLATWYKQALKESILSQIYANKSKTAGVDLSDPVQAQQEVYQQYVKAFKKGVYNFIKEENDPVTSQMIPRKYFSGGWTSKAMVVNKVGAEQAAKGFKASGLDKRRESFDSVSGEVASSAKPSLAMVSPAASAPVKTITPEDVPSVAGFSTDSQEARLDKMLSWIERNTTGATFSDRFAQFLSMLKGVEVISINDNERMNGPVENLGYKSAIDVATGKRIAIAADERRLYMMSAVTNGRVKSVWSDLLFFSSRALPQIPVALTAAETRSYLSFLSPTSVALSIAGVAGDILKRVSFDSRLIEFSDEAFKAIFKNEKKDWKPELVRLVERGWIIATKNPANGNVSFQWINNMYGEAWLRESTEPSITVKEGKVSDPITYTKPITLVLADRVVLQITSLSDLRRNPNDPLSKSEFPDQGIKFVITDGAGGSKALREGEEVVLGRVSLQDRFSSLVNPLVSRGHVRIVVLNGQFIVKDGYVETDTSVKASLYGTKILSGQSAAMVGVDMNILGPTILASFGIVGSFVAAVAASADLYNSFQTKEATTAYTENLTTLMINPDKKALDEVRQALAARVLPSNKLIRLGGVLTGGGYEYSVAKGYFVAKINEVLAGNPQLIEEEIVRAELALHFGKKAAVDSEDIASLLAYRSALRKTKGVISDISSQIINREAVDIGNSLFIRLHDAFDLAVDDLKDFFSEQASDVKDAAMIDEMFIPSVMVVGGISGFFAAATALAYNLFYGEPKVRELSESYQAALNEKDAAKADQTLKALAAQLQPSNKFVKAGWVLANPYFQYTAAKNFLLALAQESIKDPIAIEEEAVRIELALTTKGQEIKGEGVERYIVTNALALRKALRATDGELIVIDKTDNRVIDGTPSQMYETLLDKMREVLGVSLEETIVQFLKQQVADVKASIEMVESARASLNRDAQASPAMITSYEQTMEFLTKYELMKENLSLFGVLNWIVLTKGLEALKARLIEKGANVIIPGTNFTYAAALADLDVLISQVALERLKDVKKETGEELKSHGLENEVLGLAALETVDSIVGALRSRIAELESAERKVRVVAARKDIEYRLKILRTLTYYISGENVIEGSRAPFSFRSRTGDFAMTAKMLKEAQAALDSALASKSSNREIELFKDKNSTDGAFEAASLIFGLPSNLRMFFRHREGAWYVPNNAPFIANVLDAFQRMEVLILPKTDTTANEKDVVTVVDGSTPLSKERVSEIVAASGEDPKSLAMVTDVVSRMVADVARVRQIEGNLGGNQQRDAYIGELRNLVNQAQENLTRLEAQLPGLEAQLEALAEQTRLDGTDGSNYVAASEDLDRFRALIAEYRNQLQNARDNQTYFLSLFQSSPEQLPSLLLVLQQLYGPQVSIASILSQISILNVYNNPRPANVTTSTKDKLARALATVALLLGVAGVILPISNDNNAKSATAALAKISFEKGVWGDPINGGRLSSSNQPATDLTTKEDQDAAKKRAQSSLSEQETKAEQYLWQTLLTTYYPAGDITAGSRFGVENTPAHQKQVREALRDFLYAQDKFTLPGNTLSRDQQEFRDIVISMSKRLLSNDPGLKPIITEAQQDVNANPTQGNLDSLNFYNTELHKGMLRLKELADRNLNLAPVAPTGGIDFDSANLNLKIKRDGNGVPLPLMSQDPAMLNAPGFVPIIREIRPAIDLPILSELQQAATTSAS